MVNFFLILVHECHSDEPESLVNLRSLQTFHMLTLLQRREAERTEINEEEKYKVFNSFLSVSNQYLLLLSGTNSEK